jgi:hypothetical protein
MVKQSIAIRRYRFPWSLLGKGRATTMSNDGCPFEWGPDVALMYLAPIYGSGAVTGCTGVAVRAPLLNIVSCLEPAVPLPDLIQGLVDRSTQRSVNSLLRRS